MDSLWKRLCITAFLASSAGAAEPQAITWLLPTNQVLKPSERYQLAAEATSKLPVRYLIESGKGQIRGSYLTVSEPGEVVVVAEQPGNSKWMPARQSRSFQVDPGGELLVKEDFSSGLSTNWVITRSFGPGVRLEAWATNGFFHLFHEKSPAPENLYTVLQADYQGIRFTDCTMKFEFSNWETSFDDEPVILAQVRVGDPRQFRSDFYCATILPKLASEDSNRGRVSRLSLMKIKSLQSTLLVRQEIELLDPSKTYRVEFSAAGSQLKASLYEVASNKALGTVQAEDGEFKTGFPAIILMDRAGKEKRGNFPVQLRVDNFEVKGIRAPE